MIRPLFQVLKPPRRVLPRMQWAGGRSASRLWRHFLFLPGAVPLPSPRAGLGSTLWHQPFLTGDSRPGQGPCPWACLAWSLDWALQERPLLLSPGWGLVGLQPSGLRVLGHQFPVAAETDHQVHGTRQHIYSPTVAEVGSPQTPWAEPAVSRAVSR